MSQRVVPLAGALTAALAAGDDCAPLVRRALTELAARAGELGRTITTDFHTYASEWGRDGTDASIWDRRGFPVHHQRAGEQRQSRTDGEFLVRTTTTADWACRTLVLVDDGGWCFLYFTGSSRSTEHGSERGFQAAGTIATNIDDAIATVGAPALARTLAGQTVPMADGWRPAGGIHLDRPPQPPAPGLFTLVVPAADRCLHLDPAGCLCWTAIPAYGSFHRDYSVLEEPELEPPSDDEVAAMLGPADAAEPDAEPSAPAPREQLSQSEVDALLGAVDQPTDDAAEPYGGGEAVPAPAGDVASPLSARQLPRLDAPPAPWS